MKVTIYPAVPTGSVAAPPSKSMAHRLLLCAGMTNGETTVRGVALSEDVHATMDCLRALNVECAYQNGSVVVSGSGFHRAEDGAVLNCRESGSTLRFLLPMCLHGGRVTLTGNGRLMERPLDVYAALCRQQGIRFEADGTCVRVQGWLRPGEFRLPGDVSSQFVSGLLFALPTLDGDSVIRLRPPVESRSYIDMTMDALAAFGVEARWSDGLTIVVPGRQTFARQQEVTVEGDWSNAAFFLAMGVPVTGLNRRSLQGDRVCEAYFESLRHGPAKLDIADCPDLGPVLFAFAAAHGGGTFTGTRRLRLKESDRGLAMREELRKFGAEMQISENRITVGGGIRAPREVLNGHNDHRIVMALAVLCAQTGGTIDGAEAVRKSFPDFFELLYDIGIKLELEGQPWNGSQKAIS